MRAAQRDIAALLAEAALSSDVIFAARAGPPFSPPFRPNATAAGFFRLLGAVAPSVRSIIRFTRRRAATFSSFGGVRERFGMVA